MKYNNIDAFLSALQHRMDELESDDAITSATVLSEKSFTEEEYEKFGTIIDEAFALSSDEADAIDLISRRLLDLGYTEDQVTEILDYEGL